MKAKLIFNLQDLDERKEHLRCVKSLDMACALFELANNLHRRKEYQTPEEVLEQVYKIIVEEYDLNIDELID